MEPLGLNHHAPPSVRAQPVPPSGGQEPALPITIPDHVLLRRIGAGSYGEVWLARHTMGMLRAVKIVYRASFKDQRPFERELSGIQKFEPISRSHEGFVDVLHVGINAEAGYFYYLMELGDDAVSGQQIDPATYAPKTLDGEIARQGKLVLTDCLRLGLALSQALAELHQHGLVHRDVKPANIIYVNGVPKLADIGLVAEVHEARSYVGTEGFIPPEGPGAPTADVFSLGKVLYEACTGKDRKDFPALPGWWGESPEHEALLELNEVILQACQNEAAKRYRSAREMHADLLVVENGKSVRRLRVLERRLTALKRAAGFAALGLLIVAAVGFEGYREWRRNLETRQRHVGEDLAYGNRALEAGDYAGALPYFADAFRLEAGDASQAASHRLRLGATLAQCPKLTQMWWLQKRVDTAQFSADGQRLLLAEDSGRAKIYDLQTGQLCGHAFGPMKRLVGARFSPDGRLVATASFDLRVDLWDAATQAWVRDMEHPDAVFSVRFSPDGRQVVTACLDGVARVWNTRTGQVERSLKQHTKGVRFATFSPDGHWLVTCSEDNTAQLWDAATGQPHGSPLRHGSYWVSYAAFSPDSRKLATASHDHKARVWEVATGREVRPEMPHGDLIESIEYSPDGRLLLSACWDGVVRLWDADTLQPVAANPLFKHGERVQYAGFSPDGRCVVTTGVEGTVRVWDLAGCAVPPAATGFDCSPDGSRLLGQSNQTFQVWDVARTNGAAPLLALHGVERAQLNRNGRFLAAIRPTPSRANETNRLLEVWNLRAGKLLAAGLPLPPAAATVVLSDDGTRVARSAGPAVQVWDVLKQQPLSPLLVHTAAVEEVCFRLDGRQLATRCGKEVRVWELPGGRLCFPPLAHPTLVSGMEFSPNGTLLVSSCRDNSLNKYFAQVWDAATGKPVGERLQHGDGVCHVAFSPDSRRVVTASEDYTAAVWDARTGRQLTPPLRHQDQVLSARFSPDGRWVATASVDYTVRIWSAETGEPLTPPFRHLNPVQEVDFLADGRGLYTVDLDLQTRLWPLPIDARPAEELCLLARLLSGGAASSAPRFAESQAEALETLWQRLQRQYPADFATSPAEVAAWHEFVAEEGRLNHQWFAVVFHLERLLALRPNDPALVTRLARAREHLRQAN